MYLKWNRDWKKLASQWESVYHEYEQFVIGEAESILDDYNRDRTGASKLIAEVYHHVKIGGENLDLSIAEKIVGKTRLKQIRDEAFTTYLSSIHMWFIDMPDYSKSNASLMNADIDELQAFWELLSGEPAHILIAVQKELIMKHPHFFWGKCDMMTLELLSVDELVEAYKLITDNNPTFSDEALKLLAQLSRGVFRRFKKYIRITFENNLNENMPLTPEHVNKAISEKQLFEDMELELCDIFADREKRMQAVLILNFLRNNSNVNIKTIAENLTLSEFVVQKLIQKLHVYRYVSVARGQGKELLTSLQL